MEDNGWKTRLTSSLRSAWKEQLYTDLTIVTQDETIYVHKLVLAVTSPYFRALLSSNLSESHSNVLKLDNVKGETLKVVLEYVYSGKTYLREDSATDILSLADYFQIHDLKRLCCSYIKNHLTPCSCLPIYEIALLHQCCDLANFAFQMALKNCSTVICDASFLSLQPSTLATLLKQKTLDITSEDELLKALMTWVAYDRDERIVWYTSLLPLLNEDQMNPIMRLVFQTEREDCPSEESSNTRSSSCTSYAKFQTLRHKREEELLIIFGGESSGRILGSAECFSVGYSNWRCSFPFHFEEDREVWQLDSQQVIPPMKYPRKCAAVAVKDNVLYLLGGQNSSQFLSSCETYHGESNQVGTFPDLPFRLHGAAATFINDQLWVVGGKSDSSCCANQDTLLVYDQMKESWCVRAPLLEGRVHFGVASLYGCLYAIGGLGRKTPKGHYALSSCEKYDVETGTWISIASMGEHRAYHGVAVLDDFIYAIGGYNGKNWLSSVERYDPLKDRWVVVSSMIGTRSSFGVTISNGRIYCIGGFSGESVLNSVEKYNPRTNMWHCVQSMRMRRYGLVAATLKLPSEKITCAKIDYSRRNAENPR